MKIKTYKRDIKKHKKKAIIAATVATGIAAAGLAGVLTKRSYDSYIQNLINNTVEKIKR